MREPPVPLVGVPEMVYRALPPRVMWSATQGCYGTGVPQLWWGAPRAGGAHLRGRPAGSSETPREVQRRLSTIFYTTEIIVDGLGNRIAASHPGVIGGPRLSGTYLADDRHAGEGCAEAAQVQNAAVDTRPRRVHGIAQALPQQPLADSGFGRARAEDGGGQASIRRRLLPA